MSENFEHKDLLEKEMRNLDEEVTTFRDGIAELRATGKNIRKAMVSEAFPRTSFVAHLCSSNS